MLLDQLLAACLLTAGGVLGVLGMCPLREVAWRFVRLSAIVVLVLTVFFGVVATTNQWWSESTPRLIACFGIGLSFLGAFGVLTIAPLLPKAAVATRSLAWIGATGACGAGLAMGMPAASSSWLATVIGYLLGGFLVGSVTVGWLLGHRYLTATEMTIDPLKKVSLILIYALVARWGFMVLAAGLILTGSSASAERWHEITQDWLILSIRIAVGLLLPTIFVYMAWECVRLRSTQSATGILFFTSIFIIIGELASHYLVNPIGLPI
jgi:hypothetical protein